MSFKTVKKRNPVLSVLPGLQCSQDQVSQVLQKAGAGPRTPLRLRLSPHTRSRHVISSHMVFTPSKHSKPSTVTRKPKQHSQNAPPEPNKVGVPSHA